MKNLSSQILIALIGLSILLCIATVELALMEKTASEETYSLWTFVFTILVAIWVTKDPLRRKFDAPFEFGFIMYLFWPFMLPWYLVKTRGPKGLVVFLGFVAIYMAPLIFGLVAYLNLN